ncbi:hypothetical protein Droror1_Dr00024029 [Drosera rotundifolia]
MNQRRPVVGRPLGTDGSDFSYRMVVDSRYTRVAQGKSHLARLLLVQAFIVIGEALFAFLPILKGDIANVNHLSLVVVLFLSLFIGESGRRQSRTSFLKIYMLLSSISMLLLGYRTVSKDLIQQVAGGQIGSVLDVYSEQLIHVIVLFTGVFLHIFILYTAVSLIRDMSPPKRSS